MPPHLVYTLFMFLAAAVFFSVRAWQPQTPGGARLRPREQICIGLAAFLGGVFAAKLPFAIWLSGTEARDASAWFADGKTLVTGLAGGYLAVEIAKLVLGIRAKTGDAYALPLALALGVGRWGCFFNGCCAGLPTDLPWGVDFGDAIRRHPTQIYESLFHLTMAGILLLIIAGDRLPWQRLKLYLIAYCGYRFLTEFIRPASPWVWGWTFFQWAALALMTGLIFQWAWDERTRRATTTT